MLALWLILKYIYKFKLQKYIIKQKYNIPYAFDLLYKYIKL